MAEAIAMLIHVVNIALALALLYIYLQNFRQLRNRMTVGLVVFALFFLAQGILNLYFEASMVMYSSGAAQSASMVLEAVKAVAFAVLAWISWD
ncbi:MAG: hypothetical protein HY514_01715 [Candidatus Aenigmarchaeota archaeon]|nr:hypothetical protein [Candidatus Aenigmarchaeota archaeon]